MNGAAFAINPNIGQLTGHSELIAVLTALLLAKLGVESLNRDMEFHGVGQNMFATS